MRRAIGWGWILCGLVACSTAPRADGCADPAKALGVSRIVEIDASAGPIFGKATRRDKEQSFLAPDEVMLTFDDGPVPWVTGPVLDTLDAFCTKATFFEVGEMALTHPGMTKEVLARGHTVGTHTWTHPLNLRRLTLDQAKDQIERGFAAVSLAAGTGVAPFFRFPGLSDSNELMSYLQSRNIAAFTVDVISNDSFIGSPQRIAERALREVDRMKGGILLFHDLKRPTAKALPFILAGLKAKGYKVVHVRSKAPVVPIPTLEAELEPKLAKAPAAASVAVASETVPPKTPDGADPAVTELAPVAKVRQTEPASEPLSTHTPAKQAAGELGRHPSRLTSVHHRRSRHPAAKPTDG
jgi:peptidoglycan/xylan/chitin deacetylase (PgdA/CDA1 family)